MPDDGAGDYSSIENLVGTKFNEWLAGDAGNNQLEGRRGNDWISGGGAEDTLLAGMNPGGARRPLRDAGPLRGHGDEAPTERRE